MTELRDLNNNLLEVDTKLGEFLKTDIFKKIRNEIKTGDSFYLKDEELKTLTKVKLIYVGRRFCTVQTENGYNISINYPSLIDKNNKGESRTTLKMN